MQANNKLRYILTCAGYGTRTVHPKGESSFRMRWKLSNSPTSARYAYDIEFDGNLIFTGEDFNWILAADEGGYRCADMFIELYSTGCEESQLLEGTRIKLSDGQWDLDACKVSIPVISPSVEECINLNESDELNIFDAGGDAVNVRLYDYDPIFEYNYTTLSGDPTSISSQNFEHFPNRRAEYPGFGCEGEIEDPYFPETTNVLFLNDQLNELERNPVTFEEILSTGSTPYHSDYPIFSGAFDAVTDGWRLYYYRYEITCIEGATFGTKYDAFFRWVREIKDVTIGAVMPSDWVYVGVVGGMDRWARPPVLSPRKRLNKPSFRFVPTGLSERNMVLIEGSNYIVGLDTNIIDTYDDNAGGTGNGNIYGIKELPNGKYLNDVIEYAVNAMCPDLSVKSEFFQINPTTVTSTNYVTGTTTYVDKIVLFQKSDVKRPWATDHATIGRFTFKELEDWLYKQFKVKRCVVGNVIRFEHISGDILRKPASIDLTVPPYDALLRATRKYQYDIEGLAAKETFSFMEARKQISFSPEDDFAGVPITYDGSCVSRKEGESVLDRKLGRITNDVIFILVNSGGYEANVTDNNTSNKYKVVSDQNKSLVSDDGFVMVATKDVSGTIYGITDAPILDTKYVYNNVMGFAHLHSNFWRFDANAEVGTINGTAVTFDTTKPIKRQIQLPFELCCPVTFDPYAAITTELGTGIVDIAEWSPTSNIMKVELLYRL